MKNLREKFSFELKQRILLLWNINHNDKCEKVDLGLPNFYDVLNDNKQPLAIYTLHLESGKKVNKDDLTSSFKEYIDYLSNKTIECLTEKEIS